MITKWAKQGTVLAAGWILPWLGMMAEGHAAELLPSGDGVVSDTLRQSADLVDTPEGLQRLSTLARASCASAGPVVMDAIENLAAEAVTTLDFTGGLEGFTSVDAYGSVAHATDVGGGAMRLTNSSGWRWRAKRVFNKSGSEAPRIHAFANGLAAAGTNGGILQFDLILRRDQAVTDKAASFGGAQYHLAINQTPPSGSGWTQRTFLQLPASAYPPGEAVATYPVSVTLYPWSGGIGDLRVAPTSNWFELQFGSNFNDAAGIEWHIDNLRVTPAPPPPPLPVPGIPCDPLATQSARSLLSGIVSQYGHHTYSGQNEIADTVHIVQASGKMPAIIEGDLMNYSPSRVERQGIPASYTESILTKYADRHLLKFAWHWNAPTHLINTPELPWWGGFYTRYTTFDLAAALADPQSTEYQLLLRDIDAIAMQLQKAAAADIPILWRPLHEAEGGWFWWGAKGPGPFKQLWRLLYQRLTNHHGLHNLVWVLTSENPDWYPGHDVVDVVGVDAYPSNRNDTLTTRWEPLRARFDGIKPIALTEFGGVPDIEAMHQVGVYFAWFSSWNGTYGPSTEPTEKVARIYQSPVVLTVDELPAIEPPPQFSANPLAKPDAQADNAYAGHSLVGNAVAHRPSDPLSFSRTAGPAWLAIASNGSLSGMPRISDAGINEFTIRATDPTGKSAETTLRILVALTHHQSWQLTHFGNAADDPAIAGDLANPDDDGLANLLEYALGTDPSHAAPSPVAWADTNATPAFTLNIPRDPAASGVSLVVESTDNLADPGSWRTADVEILINNPDLLTVRDSQPGQRRFFRLRATRDRP